MSSRPGKRRRCLTPDYVEIRRPQFLVEVERSDNFQHPTREYFVGDVPVGEAVRVKPAAYPLAKFHHSSLKLHQVNARMIFTCECEMVWWTVFLRYEIFYDNGVEEEDRELAEANKTWCIEPVPDNPQGLAFEERISLGSLSHPGLVDVVKKE